MEESDPLVGAMLSVSLIPASITFVTAPDYQYSGAGSVTLSGESEISVGVSKGLRSEWSVQGVFSSVFRSEWEVGEGEYYWYRVQGSCGEVRCDTNGILYPDCENMTFMTVVAARNVTELCQTLSNPTINPRVDFRLESIKKYTRPVARSGSDECNELEDQEFCQVAECLDYCLDQDIRQGMSFSMRAIESIFNFEMSGLLRLSGQVQTDRNKLYFPESPVVGISGSAPPQWSVFYSPSFDNPILLSGSAEESSSSYNFESDGGGFGLSGFARTSSPGRTYSDMEGELVLSGGAGLLYAPSLGGSLVLSGSSDNFVTMRFPFLGKLELGGRLVDYVAPTFNRDWSGGVGLGGSASYNFRDLGLYSVPFLLAMDGFDFASESGELDYATDLTIDDPTVSPPCGCGPVSMRLFLESNVSKSSFVSNFLNRSGISMGDSVDMRYRSSESSWRSIIHLLGRGRDGVSLEDLTFSYLLGCSDGFWNFSFSAESSNRVTGDVLRTKFILDIPSDVICSDGSISTRIEARFDFDGYGPSTTGEAFLVTDPASRRASGGSSGLEVLVDGNFIGERVYYDQIGIFKDSYWRKSPMEIKINLPGRTSMPRINLDRIFG